MKIECSVNWQNRYRTAIFCRFGYFNSILYTSYESHAEPCKRKPISLTKKSDKHVYAQTESAFTLQVQVNVRVSGLY